MKFCTIFRKFDRVHLNKDVGLIPRVLKENYDVESCILFSSVNKNISSEDCYNVRMIGVDFSFPILFYIYSLFYVLKNKIDVVNLYHFNKETMLFIAFLKLFKVKVYLKMDLDNQDFEKLKYNYSNSLVRRSIYDYFSGKVDLFSIENKEFYEYFSSLKSFKNKIYLFLNGPSDSSILSQPLDFDLRENVILIVGRMGAYQKNYEPFIEWLMTNDLASDSWSVKLVGEMTDEFYQKYKKLKNSEKGHCVDYLGTLSRNDIFELYRKSKVLLVTSRWEGFSLAMAEAAVMGMYICSTDVSGLSDMTDNYNYCSVIEDGKIGETINNVILSHLPVIQYSNRLEYCRKNLIIDNNIETIYHSLMRL